MFAHAANIYLLHNLRLKIEHETSFTFPLSTWSIVRIFKSIDKCVIFWKNYVVTIKILMSTLIGSGDTWSVLEFHLTFFEQIWGSFHVMSHVVRMIDLSSLWVSSFFMMNTWMISMIMLKIINDIKFSMSATRHFLTTVLDSTRNSKNVRWSFSSLISTLCSYNCLHVVLKKYGSGQTMDQHVWFVVFVINRLNPRRGFTVSSWILSIDYDWFSRLRTILYQHEMK